jgi:membrane associated rhomboid family serine protease
MEHRLKLQGLVLATFVALMWIVELIDLLLGLHLDAWGIRPRDPVGLLGIVFAPFLHAGFHHLLANTFPFLVLGWFVLLWGTARYFAVTIVVMLLGGLGVWLVGRSGSVHLGASGLIFGYLGHLLLGGYFERRLSTIAGSIAVAMLYGGLVFEVLPGTPGISWESHLFGFLAGAFMARALARRTPRRSRT